MKRKTKKVKTVSYKTEEQKEIIKLVAIIGIVAVVALGVYFLTKKFVIKEYDKYAEPQPYEVVPGSVNYNVTIIGSLLDRPYSEYYVLLYDGSTKTSNKYSIVYSKYAKENQGNKKATKLYYVDLSNILNKSYVAGEGEKSNPEAKTIDELKLGEFTLIKVKKGKIDKYIEGLEDIKKELKI